MTIENICKQIIPAAKFAIRLAMANFQQVQNKILCLYKILATFLCTQEYSTRDTNLPVNNGVILKLWIYFCK